MSVKQGEWKRAEYLEEITYPIYLIIICIVCGSILVALGLEFDIWEFVWYSLFGFVAAALCIETTYILVWRRRHLKRRIIKHVNNVKKKAKIKR